ncbi:ATP-dependent DNA helicase PIF1 [Senna tora]|uniref:ATP-dependent DNA helicase PIF1 n=1 Tax=Senna tora TaxID=362788 RepID=A0A835CDS4_9FABA|nr:ATP-dependent DNA helicase PIF1 [Senna tora]
MMRYEERLKTKNIVHPKFSLCCMKGKVQLPAPKKTPKLLFDLFTRKDSSSPDFMKEIRNYNNMFAFTSMGGKIDHSVNNVHLDHRLENLRLKLIRKRNSDARTYNLPSASKVAAIIVRDLDMETDKRDIIVETRSGLLQRIDELHPLYLPMQYPLLFPYGEDGYHRRREFNMILKGRKLTQQFTVDAFIMIEALRTKFFRLHQKNLRIESYVTLRTELSKGQLSSSAIGKRIILPSSFTGSQRYSRENFQDAMTICTATGFPDLFIIFTCNLRLPELDRLFEGFGCKPEDRPDLVSRIFKIKLNMLIKDITKDMLFEKCRADIYTIEFKSVAFRMRIYYYEIKQYYDCRYISPCEAAWRIFGFDIKFREPYVERLPFNLVNQQIVVFCDEDVVDDVVEKASLNHTKFHAWFEENKVYPIARHLTYAQFPTKFVFKTDSREWTIRKSGRSIGRFFYVQPGSGELYYLRVLLTFVKGATSFKDIRTIHGVLHPTYKDECYSLGLLDDDKEYIDGINKASR